MSGDLEEKRRRYDELRRERSAAVDEENRLLSAEVEEPSAVRRGGGKQAPVREWHCTSFKGTRGYLTVAAFIVTAYRLGLLIMDLVDTATDSRISIDKHAITMYVLLGLDSTLLIVALIVWVTMGSNDPDKYGSKYLNLFVFLVLMTVFSIIQVVNVYYLDVHFIDLSPTVVDNHFQDKGVASQPEVVRIYSKFDQFISFSMMSYCVAFYLFFGIVVAIGK